MNTFILPEVKRALRFQISVYIIPPKNHVNPDNPGKSIAGLAISFFRSSPTIDDGEAKLRLVLITPNHPITGE